jgi:hypothetical protein
VVPLRKVNAGKGGGGVVAACTAQATGRITTSGTVEVKEVNDCIKQQSKGGWVSIQP